MEHQSPLEIPRRVIGAPHGRSGKTTATRALVGAFAARSLVVQPFKKGPDYIDPSWLTAGANRAARNLDSFMLRDDAMVGSVARADPVRRGRGAAGAQCRRARRGRSVL